MPKLTELKGKENLPEKIYPHDPRLCLPPEDRGYVKAIDQYNQLEIDGEVEALTEIIYDKDMDDSLGSREICRVLASQIISNLSKFLVVKKGG